MSSLFSRYQIFIIGLLAFIQFTVILDFMILSPLGVFVMPALKILPHQFSAVVSVYAVSAGISGILSAGFADKFDRKKFLLFFYTGFVIGTVLCALATSYEFLLFARVITGIFGGVISGTSFAIVADLFPMETRGRVIGFIMTAFAVSQVAGLPLGVFIAKHIGWQYSFWLIAAVSLAVGLVIVIKLKPLTTHLVGRHETRPFPHLAKTLSNPVYLVGFAATMLLATGGFMLMPFGSAFTVHNLGISPDDLPWVYLITGLVSLGAGPLAGRLADAFGKYTVFFAASVIAVVVLLFYTQMGISSFWLVVAINSALFVAITGRMISANALTSAVPALKDRGAYMAISSALQQESGALSSFCAGQIVSQEGGGYLKGYDILGYVVAAAIFVTVFLMYFVNRMVSAKTGPAESGLGSANALERASEV
ncbi:MFS transporter [Leptospira wolffii]|uniref:MFS transporter n=1 Tax=Leptospira wolffii TaxID=409998 RepID=A0ABV5BM62_9LEPT